MDGEQRRVKRSADTSRELDDEVIAQGYKIARLPRDARRRAQIRPQLVATYTLIDTLDEIEVGDTPPATAFDPRWE